jgi:nicotinamidase-related amidase
MNELLIVVDYQNDFVDGSLGFPGAERLEDPICDKILLTNRQADGRLYFGYTRRELSRDKGRA